jgi:uncharacterized protein (TIGR03437 family)
VITTAAGTDYVFPRASEPASNVLLNEPTGIAVDAAGNVYVSDQITQVVLKLTPAGVASVYAGNGFYYHSGDGGPATLAGLVVPQGMAVDPSGNLYIAELAGVRRVDSNGIITTVAGNGVQISSGDGGPATEAGLNRCVDVALDSVGNLYIAESGANRVRRVDPSGTITTYAGTGRAGYTGDGGQATNANISVNAIAVDSKGNLFIADSSDKAIRIVTPQGVISTLVSGSVTSGPAIGSPIDPQRIAVGPNGAVYFTDGPYVFQMLGGVLSTAFTAIGRVNFEGIAVNSGNLYVTDTMNLGVQMISGGVAKTIAASTGAGKIGDGGQALSAYLDNPTSIALDNQGGYYILDQAGEVVRYVNSLGIIQTVAGTGVAGFSGDGGPATNAQLSQPTGVAVDSAGNLYIADFGNGRIRKVSKGIISTYAGGVLNGSFQDTAPLASAVVGAPYNIAFSQAGELYFSDFEYRRVRRVTGGNIVTYAGNGNLPAASPSAGVATSVAMSPQWITFDPSGDLYITSEYTSGWGILKVTPQGALTLFAGTGNVLPPNDGVPATSASLVNPAGITADPSGNLYIAELNTGLVRVIGSDSILRTAAGTNLGFSGDGGPATSAQLDGPEDVKSDASGALFIADSANHRIREILVNPPSIGVSAVSLSFEAASGGAPTAAQSVGVTGSIPGVQFTVTISPPSAAQWLIPNYSSGATPLILTFQADPTSLAPGTYPATITINALLAAPATQNISVTFVVDPGQPPTLALDKNSLSFGFPRQGTSHSQLIQVENVGGGALSFSVTTVTQSGGSWLSATPASGTAHPGSPALMTVTANPAGLQTGTYQGTVTVMAGSQSIVVPVIASVSALNQAILLGQTGLSFLAVSGGGIVPPQSFGVYNTGSGSMAWNASTSTASGGPWLQANPATGTSDGLSSTTPRITVTVNPAGVAPGRYYGLVKVTSSTAANSPQVVTATLEVLPAGQDPGAVVQPAQLNFFFPADFGTVGRPGAQQVTIYDLSAQSLNFVAQAPLVSGETQLALAPFTSTVGPQSPAQVVVQPLGPMPPKSTLTIQFSDGTLRQVPITFTVVSPRPAAKVIQGLQASPSGCTPSKLVPALSAIGELATHVNAGWPAALTASVLDDCGQPHTSGSVIASFSSGDPPVRLQSSNDGNWEGTWQNSYGGQGPVTITVVASDPSLNLTGSSQTVANLIALQEPPVFSAAGVVSNADPASNVPLGLGAILSIYGNQLSATPAGFSGPSLPTKLGTTQVLIAGEFAPLYYVSPGLINFQVPYNIQADTQQQLVVLQGNALSVPVTVNVAQAQPASFLNAATAPNAALAFVLRDGTGFIATPSSPAQAGDELILYLSGLGSVGPFSAGQIAPLGPYYQTQNPVTVTIGGVAVTPDFAGLAPTFIGLYQLNVRVPAGVQTGPAVPLTVQVLNLVSPTVVIPIQ